MNFWMSAMMNAVASCTASPEGELPKVLVAIAEKDRQCFGNNLISVAGRWHQIAK